MYQQHIYCIVFHVISKAKKKLITCHEHDFKAVYLKYNDFKIDLQVISCRI